jgi:ribosomal protein S18 acetylase RimI-like enzyme
MNAEFITVRVIDRLTNEMLDKINAFHNFRQGYNDYLRGILYEKEPHFHVIAESADGEILGHLIVNRNAVNPKSWLYGDLDTHPAYRRQGIARKLVQCAIDRIADLGGERFVTYVAPDNTASIALQQALDFSEAPYEKFDSIDTTKTSRLSAAK